MILINLLPHREIANKRRKEVFQMAMFGALLAGLLAAAAIALTASDDAGDALGYEFIDGQAYAIEASDSKMYRHELERFGGKAAVLADDLNRWFSSLWRGKRLAITVAFLSAALALLVFRAGRTSRKGKGDAHEP